MNKGKLGAALRLVGMGWYVAFCIIGGAIGGLWIDALLNTKVLFGLIGLVLGLFMALVGVFRMLAGIVAANSNRDDEEQ